MQQIEEFVDSRQKGFCIHCGTLLDKSNRSRDHVPSKCLLLPPYPDNLPVVQICGNCNNSYSQDEEYLVAFLGAVLAGSSDPSCQVISTAKRILERNDLLRQRIEESKTEIMSPEERLQYTWKPETQRVSSVIMKNARGHAFFEYGEPILDEPDEVWSLPLVSMTQEQRMDFEMVSGHGELAAWPEVGSRMMTRVLTRQDLAGSWIVVQDGVYRYAVEQQGQMRVRSVLFEYLATEVSWTQ
jgi:hypothetical protein